ncbi:MAG: GNAT family N-acetyltransferase [Aestuariibacter sp.]
MQKVDLPDGLGIRLARANDGPFLAALFQESREHFYIAEQENDYIRALIEQQQEIQTNAYGQQTPDAMDYIIDRQGTRIGKVTIDFGKNVAHIVDLVLTKAVRGKGYGKSIIQAFQYVAHKQSLPVCLSVEKQNTLAKNLYLSLGFATEEQTATHEFMYWYPHKSKIYC